ncbi:hypothetical protein ACWCPM_12930 [Streptomyces sp. NPDC002309]
MSFGDPNNPYGAPQGQQPGYGYPQQPAPGHGYPQAPPAGYPGYPGSNMMAPQSMPGLLVTARVFLFIISAVQILGGIIWLYVAAFVNDITDTADELSTTSDSPFTFGEGGDMAAGLLVFVALVALSLAALSITLGVKFGKGGQGIRITTVVYGALGTILGLIGLFVGLDSGMASATIFPLLWVAFGAVITAAPVVPSGTAWFARPRY